MDSLWKRAIVVGASSGIGEQIVRMLAASGCEVAAVARRYELLRKVSEELNGARPNTLQIYEHDVTRFAETGQLFSQIVANLGGLDLIVYAAGVMPKVDPTEYDTDKDTLTIETNLVGAIAWLNAAAKRFERAQEGTILAIGSPSGDRGRRGNPAYGASKAGLEAYLESLRNRLSQFGVSVVTVKPGPVRTEMTHHLGKLPGEITAEKAAAGILKGARRFGKTFYVPGKWWLAARILRMIPSPIFRRMKV
ncbi:MAG TPA: SDR family NAD(P)-dependent oxidoreductase [Fimbriimonadales bacterium]|jgi:NAD(P)-dependent dehydrogenase (short-subunit alcohol dehydrogenase family)|nr:SDR family NAD(P)-dependent oxidoreductase [Fimbriimonadales bacterium]